MTELSEWAGLLTIQCSIPKMKIEDDDAEWDAWSIQFTELIEWDDNNERVRSRREIKWG